MHGIAGVLVGIPNLVAEGGKRNTLVLCVAAESFLPELKFHVGLYAGLYGDGMGGVRTHPQ